MNLPTVVLVMALVSAVSLADKTPGRDFYVIAHMANNENIVRWALSSGVNSLEIDVQFHSRTGELTTVHHGVPCDCTCYLNLSSGGVCDHAGVCKGQVRHERVFEAIMADPALPNLAQIYIDSKIPGLSDEVQALAGGKVIEAMEKELFSKGYRGTVLIGVGSMIYLNAVVDRALRSNWLSQIYVTYDMFEDAMEAIGTMTKLDYPNKVFSVGLSACSPTQYYKETAIGAVNRAHGHISEVVVWTVDKEASWEKYYSLGARGMITNFIHEMLDWVSRKGLTLAKPREMMVEPPKPFTDYTGGLTLQIEPITDIGTCDCGYSKGGCSIYTPAPPLSACQCTYDALWACSGTVVGCDQEESEYCLTPDTSLFSCVQGGGDCGGYYDPELSCDCMYHPGGCTIYTAPPPGYACKCSYDLAWACSGSVTKCRDPFDPHCATPDTSIYSCLQGKGDCGGYSEPTCECSYGAGGCTVTKPAPAGTACRCDYMLAWTCRGTIVSCRHDDAPECKEPDMSVASCLEGGGESECGAYSETCECGVEGEGCVVSEPAPAGTSCRCAYWGWPYYSCYPKLVGCTVARSESCRHPDTSVDSCRQGGGNCAGYKASVDY